MIRSTIPDNNPNITARALEPCNPLKKGTLYIPIPIIRLKKIKIRR